MAARAALVVLLAVLAAAPAGADTIVEQKASVDARIARLDDRVDAMRAQEDAVRGELAAVSTRIRALAGQVSDVSSQLEPLERELGLRRERLHRLDVLFRLQSKRLELLRRQHRIAVARLSKRLVGLYQQEQPDTLTLLLTSSSFSDLFDALDYVRRMAAEDKHIADAVAAAKARVRAQRERTRETRARHRQELRALAVRVEQVRELRERLIASQSALEGERAAHQQALADLTQQQQDELAEMESLQAVSATLTAKIQAAQAADTGGGSVSSSGLIWPVNGPVTSPFGTRWGRMHEGIDIGVPMGTAIHAAGSGTVIYAGWMGGYGNLTVIDHGNGLATAYGHQSGIAVGTGQTVSQGQVIGYVGSTGHSTGPHLHFEVRVNGVPVDPLSYLS
jgi:murein DD-endopeptidase MepM/ murein hydrolase activator NlpD